MPEVVKRNRNILVALTPDMLARLKALSDRIGVKSATLAALAVGEMVQRLEAPDRAIRASTDLIAEHLQRHGMGLENADHDGTRRALAP